MGSRDNQGSEARLEGHDESDLRELCPGMRGKDEYIVPLAALNIYRESPSRYIAHDNARIV